MTANTQASAGARFRQALVEESPLQIVGTINANHALLAKLDALFAQNRG